MTCIGALLALFAAIAYAAPEIEVRPNDGFVAALSQQGVITIAASTPLCSLRSITLAADSGGGTRLSLRPRADGSCDGQLSEELRERHEIVLLEPEALLHLVREETIALSLFERDERVMISLEPAPAQPVWLRVTQGPQVFALEAKRSPFVLPQEIDSSRAFHAEIADASTSIRRSTVSWTPRPETSQHWVWWLISATVALVVALILWRLWSARGTAQREAQPRLPAARLLRNLRPQPGARYIVVLDRSELPIPRAQVICGRATRSEHEHIWRVPQHGRLKGRVELGQQTQSFILDSDRQTIVIRLRSERDTHLQRFRQRLGIRGKFLPWRHQTNRELGGDATLDEAVYGKDDASHDEAFDL